MDAARITLLRRAFKSGSSEFWRARLVGAGGFSKPVLVKRLTPEVAAEPRHVERERAEALLTGRLVHPNVMSVLDYCLVEGQAVTVFEDLRVVDLLHLLERATVERRRLAPRLALGVAWSVLNALVHAHHRVDPTLGIAGVAHGDLSPQNIMIDVGGRVLVRDFGIPLQVPRSAPLGESSAAVLPARAESQPGIAMASIEGSSPSAKVAGATSAPAISTGAAPSPLSPPPGSGPVAMVGPEGAAAGSSPGLQVATPETPEPLARLGRLHGKPGYMSPELVTRGVITPRSDVFAVGILLYELLTFRRLFGGKDGAETLKAVAMAQVDERIARYAGDLPMPLRELMRKALRRQPDERFAGAADMLRTLEHFFPGNPHEVAPELAHYLMEIAPPEDEEGESVVDLSLPAARRRTGRRAPSRMILPAAGNGDDADFEAEFSADHWANKTLPPIADADVVQLLADIEPVGPPPLPPDALEPPPLPILDGPPIPPPLPK